MSIEIESIPMFDDEFKGTTIPDIRVRLLDIAGDIESALPIAAMRIRECVQDMYRRKAIRHTKARQKAPTEEQLEQIRRFAATHDNLSEWEIGRRLGWNQGRISEALHGKRR